MARTPTFTRNATIGLCVAASIALAATSLLVAHRADSRAQHAADHAVTKVQVPPNVDHITIEGSGDILVHPPTWQQAAQDAAGTNAKYDFTKIFSGIAYQVESADLSICHLEAPMGPGAPEDFPRFRAPLELGPALKRTGYDACSTASNHSMDQGEAGVYASLDALDAARLPHTGTYRTRKAADTPVIYTVKGVKVAHLSYTFNFNGLPRPRGKPWVANEIEPEAILSMARKARRAGADIVVLSMHAGVELDHTPGADQERWGRQFIASPDIDLILGHHAHVVQPFEKIGDKWIAWGMGNTLARHDFPVDANREGAMGRFTFTKDSTGRWKATRAEAIPIWLSLKPKIRIITLAPTIARMAPLDDRRRKYTQTLTRVGKILDRRGAIKDGLIIDGITTEATR